MSAMGQKRSFRKTSFSQSIYIFGDIFRPATWRQFCSFGETQFRIEDAHAINSLLCVCCLSGKCMTYCSDPQ